MVSLAAVSLTAQAATRQGDADARRREADDLLKRGRQALKEGNLPDAETLLARAEALQVDYPVLTLSDTPQQLRRDLQRARNAAGEPSGAARLGNLLRGSKESVPAQDPFAAAGGSQPQQPAALPQQLAQGPMPPFAGAVAAQPASAPASDSARRQSDELLVSARRALAVGDTRRAATLVQQAKTLQVNYGLLDDSPAKVEGVISKHNDLMQRRATSSTPEVYNRQYSELLLEQADALLRWRSLAEAERLTTDASRLNVNYGPFETRPDDLLKRIAAAKNAPAGFAPEASARPLADRTPAQGAAPSPAAKQQALALVGRARQAMAAGDFLAAETLARQAEELRLPDTVFGPQEDRPSMVLLDLTRARMNGVRQAGGPQPAALAGGVNQALYDPRMDRTRNMPAANQTETLPPPGGFNPQVPGRVPGGIDRAARAAPRMVRAPRQCRLAWTRCPTSRLWC